MHVHCAEQGWLTAHLGSQQCGTHGAMKHRAAQSKGGKVKETELLTSTGESYAGLDFGKLILQAVCKK